MSNDIVDFLQFVNNFTPTFALILAIFFGIYYMKNKGPSEERYGDNVVDNSVHKTVIDKEGGNANLGGYTVIDMPESKKGLFQDILKGFEEYAEAKGYKVSISTDASTEGKIAFKFTIVEYGVTTSTNQVKKDLNEYIKRIQDGDNFESLAEVSDSLEVQKIIMILQNRLSFLQQNYQVEKNIKEFYERFFDKINLNSMSHQPLSLQFNQTGQGAIEMDNKSYSSNNSANVMQGDNHSGLIESGNINIGGTHNERAELIEKLDKLLNVLDSTDSNISKAKRKLESVKDELQDEEKPDKTSIFKWVTKAKDLLDSAKVAKDIFSQAKEVYDAFGIQL